MTLHTKTSRTVTPYLSLVASLILQGRKRSIQILGFDPALVVLLISSTSFKEVFPFSTDLQISLADYTGRIGCHYPSGKLWDFLKRTAWVIHRVVRKAPIPSAPTYFIDGSSSVRAGVWGPAIQRSMKIPYTSAQTGRTCSFIVLTAECSLSYKYRI